MTDFRPVGYVIGLLVTVFGALMLVPLAVDLAQAQGQWPVFLESALITLTVGVLLAVACQSRRQEGLNLQQIFLLTTGIWVVLPLFGAIPLIIGATELRIVDAVFESMSGLTTTGSTVISGLDELPKGILLWRGMLQWLGGVGIVIVALIFLPELRVGGMQVFRTESFDTFGKILPRATSISGQIIAVYLMLTLGCITAYLSVGLNVFDATVHAMTTVSTGGFSNYDASFGTFDGTAEYVAVVFMILGSLPFVRFVQLVNGNPNAMMQDSQARTFLVVVAVLVTIAIASLHLVDDMTLEPAVRKALFNITSILSGTGYASADYMQWGSFMVALFFFIGLIGGCAGSTACSAKIFRYQLVFASLVAQLHRIYSPRVVYALRFDGRRVTQETLNSVMAFFVFFIVTIGVVSVALGMTGLDFITSVSGAATAVANVGPGLGPIIGPSGNFAPLNDLAKWILTFAMLIGRLELITFFALFTTSFWRA